MLYQISKHDTLIINDLLRTGYKTLFDPCCGSSEYLVEGLKQGMESVYGIEIIPEKVALGLKKIEDMGYKVEKIS